MFNELSGKELTGGFATLLFGVLGTGFRGGEPF